MTDLSTCKHCGRKTEHLYGLFTPHAYKECMDHIRTEDINNYRICTLCRQPYCDCVC